MKSLLTAGTTLLLLATCGVEGNFLLNTAATTFTSQGYYQGSGDPCWTNNIYYHDIRGGYAFNGGCLSNWNRVREDAGHLDPSKHCSIWFNGTRQTIPGPTSGQENGWNHVAALTMWSPGGFVGAISQWGGTEPASFYMAAADACKWSFPQPKEEWIGSSIDMIVTPRNPEIMTTFMDGNNTLCSYNQTGLKWNVPVVVSPAGSWVSRGSTTYLAAGCPDSSQPVFSWKATFPAPSTSARPLVTC